MGILFFLLGSIFALLPAPAQPASLGPAIATPASQAAKPAFTITIVAEPPALKISPDSYVTKAGQDVFIRVRLTNTSKHNLTIADDEDTRSAIDPYHHYEIRDSAGHSAEKRPYHSEAADNGRPYSPRTLKPGESADVASDRISALFDLTQPGKYVIQLSRSITGDSHDGEVKSNAIILTVTQ
jgi:hypothetical protein